MGLTFFDTSFVLALLNRQDAHNKAARDRVHVIEMTDRAVSVVVVAESMVGPTRTGKSAAEAARRFFEQTFALVAPVSMDVALEAASLRAKRRSLKLPDALIIATADIRKADRVLTFDRRWKKASPLVEVVG